MFKKLVVLIVAVVLVVSVGNVSSASSTKKGGDDGEGGPKEIHVYHDYFIPWVTGMDNCYGAYRVVGSRGSVSLSTISGNSITTFPNLKKKYETVQEYLASHSDFRTVDRDDVTVFTDFLIKAEKTDMEYDGNYIYYHHRKYHYETPYGLVGFVADMNAAYGSEAYDSVSRPLFIALDRQLIKKYMPAFNPLMLLPGYNGAEPNGTEVAKKQVGENRYHYIFTLSTDIPDLVGWWNMYSADTLGAISYLRDNISQYMDSPTPAEKELLKKRNDELRRGAVEPLPAGFPDLTDPWNVISIHFESDSLAYYLCASAPKTTVGATNMFDAGKGFLRGSNDMRKIWEEMASRLADSVIKTGGRDSVPPNNGSFIVDFLGTSMPGFWTLPYADILNPKYPSLALTVNNPDFIGRWPFAGAQDILMHRKKTENPATASGSTEESLRKLFGEASIKLPSSAVDGFIARIGKDPSMPGHPINPRQGMEWKSAWSEPWLVGQPNSQDIWYWWYKTDPYFYAQIVPYMSSEIGVFLRNSPAGYPGTKVIEKRREAVLRDHAKNPSITHLMNFDRKSVAEILSKNIKSEKMDSFRKLALEDKGMKDAGTRFQGKDEHSLFTKTIVRYFPYDAEKAVPLYLKEHPVFSSSLSMPDFGEHRLCWSSFPVNIGGNVQVPIWNSLPEPISTTKNNSGSKTAVKSNKK